MFVDTITKQDKVVPILVVPVDVTPSRNHLLGCKLGNRILDRLRTLDELGQIPRQCDTGEEMATSTKGWRKPHWCETSDVHHN